MHQSHTVTENWATLHKKGGVLLFWMLLFFYLQGCDAVQAPRNRFVQRCNSSMDIQYNRTQPRVCFYCSTCIDCMLTLLRCAAEVDYCEVTLFYLFKLYFGHLHIYSWRIGNWEREWGSGSEGFKLSPLSRYGWSLINEVDKLTELVKC